VAKLKPTAGKAALIFIMGLGLLEGLFGPQTFDGSTLSGYTWRRKLEMSPVLPFPEQLDRNSQVARDI
jgi:hypothetical protein